MLKLLGSLEVGRFTGKLKPKFKLGSRGRQRLVDQPFLDRAAAASGGQADLAGAIRRWPAGFDRDGCFMRKLNRTFGLGRLNLRASKVWRAPVRPPEQGRSCSDALQRAIGLALEVPESGVRSGGEGGD